MRMASSSKASAGTRRAGPVASAATTGVAIAGRSVFGTLGSILGGNKSNVPCKEADNGVKDRNDAVDNGHDDATDTVDNRHDSPADGADAVLDL